MNNNEHQEAQIVPINLRAPFAVFAALTNQNQGRAKRRVEDDVSDQRLALRTLRRRNARLLAERDTLKTKVSELRVACERDPLTNVRNRRGLERAFLQMQKSKTLPGRGHVLVFLDGDQFGQINKIHGDDVGDLVIQEIATSLQKCTRKTDVVARKGGDEFIVLLRNVPLNRLTHVIEGPRGLQHRINTGTRVQTATTSLHINCSMGAVLFGSDDDLDATMRRADAVMRGNKMVRKAIRLLNAA